MISIAPIITRVTRAVAQRLFFNVSSNHFTAEVTPALMAEHPDMALCRQWLSV